MWPVDVPTVTLSVPVTPAANPLWAARPWSAGHAPRRWLHDHYLRSTRHGRGAGAAAAAPPDPRARGGPRAGEWEPADAAAAPALRGGLPGRHQPVDQLPGRIGAVDARHPRRDAADP